MKAGTGTPRVLQSFRSPGALQGTGQLTAPCHPTALGKIRGKRKGQGAPGNNAQGEMWTKEIKAAARQDGGGGWWKEDPKTGQTQGLGVRIAELNLFASYFVEQDQTARV